MKNNKKKKIEIEKQLKMIEKILKDRPARQSIVQKSFDWFFSVYFHNYIKYETAPFHREIFQIIEDPKIELAVIVAFRGSAKSTIVTTASVLWSILGSPQNKFVIILSQTEQKARQHLQNIKMELENNEVLRKDLGPFDEEKNQWGSTALIIKKFNAKIMISSSEQSIRGMRFMENRPDLIIIDDIEDIDSVKTQEGRNKTSDWLTGEVLPARGKKSKVIIVGNLLHEDSLLKRLQEKIEKGEVNGVYKEYPIVDKNGNSLWPGRYPTPASIEEERIKTMDDIAWAREYLLKIIPKTNVVVRKEWIQYYDELPGPDSRYRYTGTGVDLAISEKTSADYTAMVSGRIYSYDKNMKIYILPNPINERMDFPTTVQRAKMLFCTLKTRLYVEDVGYQRSASQQLRAEGIYAEEVPTHGQDKESRLRLTTALIQSGRILFPKDACKELITQLLGFGTEKHDDLVDAFSILILKAIESGKGGARPVQRIDLL
jgi:predicted phage terminase large subunit-like protein